MLFSYMLLLETLFLKEALIKSDVQITPSDFSSDCAKAAQESCRISSGFCAI